MTNDYPKAWQDRAAELYPDARQSDSDSWAEYLSANGEQVMLRAAYLRGLGESKVLIEALEKIAKWELPTTGKFWDKEKTRPTNYETEYGSNGARDFIKSIATQALATFPNAEQK